MTELTAEQKYARRLDLAIDALGRTQEGLFLMQHILRSANLFDAGGNKDAEMIMAGKRSIAVQLIEEMRRGINGTHILKAVMNKLIDVTDEEFENVPQIPEYNPISMLGT